MEELRTMPMATHHLILVRHAEEQNSKKESAGLTVIGECPINNANIALLCPWPDCNVPVVMSLLYWKSLT